MAEVQLQTTDTTADNDFRAEDYLNASKKVLHQRHRAKILAVAIELGIDTPDEQYEDRGDIIAAIVAHREEQANG